MCGRAATQLHGHARVPETCHLRQGNSGQRRRVELRRKGTAPGGVTLPSLTQRTCNYTFTWGAVPLSVSASDHDSMKTDSIRTEKNPSNLELLAA